MLATFKWGLSFWKTRSVTGYLNKLAAQSRSEYVHGGGQLNLLNCSFPYAEGERVFNHEKRSLRHFKQFSHSHLKPDCVGATLCPQFSQT
jgi:hypothetical protein